MACVAPGRQRAASSGAASCMFDEIDHLGKDDLEYAEAFMKQLYAVEIDRKDKILASMSVVASPIAILIAGVAFLVNGVVDKPAEYITASPDIAVVVFLLLMLSLFASIAHALYNFHRLLSGENYHYLPDASGVLGNIAAIKAFCDQNNISSDGAVTSYARVNFIKQYAACAAKNCASNDIRLKYRQRVFRSTMLAVIFSALGLVAVAVHRGQPNIWDVSKVWRKSNVQPPQGSQSAAPARDDQRQPASSSFAPADTGHQ